MPFAFAEHGVAQLSSVLKGDYVSIDGRRDAKMEVTICYFQLEKNGNEIR